MQEDVGQRVRQRRERAEIGVVALALARYRSVDGVVDVVIPLRGHPVPTLVARRDQPRIVQVALRDHHQRPRDLPLQLGDAHA